MRCSASRGETADNKIISRSRARGSECISDGLPRINASGVSQRSRFRAFPMTVRVNIKSIELSPRTFKIENRLARPFASFDGKKRKGNRRLLTSYVSDDEVAG